MPGWDCHGLPIELKVLQSMKDEERKALTPIKLRQKVSGRAESRSPKARTFNYRPEPSKPGPPLARGSTSGLASVSTRPAGYSLRTLRCWGARGTAPGEDGAFSSDN